MSLFGAMTTAVSGLNAQSRSLGHISDNLANQTTIGYKRLDTQFQSMVASSTAKFHNPGGVQTTPFRNVMLQGSLQQSSIDTHLAINGDGFFAVSNFTIREDGTRTFSEPVYTRAGDFTINRDGFMVNSAGYFLNGWRVTDPERRSVDTNLQPIQINDLRNRPEQTTFVEYNVNLPSGATAGQDVDPTTGDIEFSASQVRIFDPLGNERDLNLRWVKMDPTIPGNENVWRVDLSASGLTNDDNEVSSTPQQAAAPGVPQIDTLNLSGTIEGGDTYSVTIDGTTLSYTTTGAEADINAVRDTLIAQINGAGLGVTAAATGQGEITLTGAVNTPFTLASSAADRGAPLNGAQTTSMFVKFHAGNSPTGQAGTIEWMNTTNAPPATMPPLGDPATIALSVDDPDTDWDFELRFGEFGQAGSLSQYAGDGIELARIDQDGVALGSLESVTVDESGFVNLNYDNGRTSPVYKIPVGVFSAPQSLQARSGTAFAETPDSGPVSMVSAGQINAGDIVAANVEASNVDIGEEFTKMIVTQRAYSANARVVTTSDNLMEEAVNLVR